MKMGRPLGLSVLEVLVSITVLAVAGLGLIAALTRVMLAQNSSSHQTVARILAEGRLQDALLAGPPEWGRDPGEPLIVPISALVGQGQTPTEFLCQMVPSNPGPVPKESSLKPDDSLGDLYKVTVQVSWEASGDGPALAAERGHQSVTVSRFTYVER